MNRRCTHEGETGEDGLYWRAALAVGPPRRRASPLLAAPSRVDAVVLTLSNAVVGIGSTTELAVSADSADGIEALSFNIEYDPAVVSAASDVSVTDVTARCMLVSNSRVPGVIQVAAACLEPLNGAGPLLTVRLLGRAAGRVICGSQSATSTRAR